MFEKLTSRINAKKVGDNCNPATSPFDGLKLSAPNVFLKNLSKRALKLYERKTDIKNFTKLALSDPEDTSHNNLVKEQELDEYDILFDLSNNDEFLKDLDL